MKRIYKNKSLLCSSVLLSTQDVLINELTEKSEYEGMDLHSLPSFSDVILNHYKDRNSF